ncbi:MAG: hypothetical protein HY678_01230 [Chloroflexi bacterium]|nr:hypothetical protein [Chloroflexota bacterium]
MTQSPLLQETVAYLVQKVPGLPEQERRRAITGALREFALMDPMQRAAAMRSVIDELGRLSSEERKAFLKSRNEAFLDLPLSTRMALMGTRVEVLSTVSPERLREEAWVLESMTPGDPQRQTVLRQMLTATRGQTDSAPKRAPNGRPPATKKRWWEIWRS